VVLTWVLWPESFARPAALAPSAPASHRAAHGSLSRISPQVRSRGVRAESLRSARGSAKGGGARGVIGSAIAFVGARSGAIARESSDQERLARMAQREHGYARRAEHGVRDSAQHRGREAGVAV